jgi:hypothetical protein
MAVVAWLLISDFRGAFIINEVLQVNIEVFLMLAIQNNRTSRPYWLGTRCDNVRGIKLCVYGFQSIFGSMTL